MSGAAVPVCGQTWLGEVVAVVTCRMSSPSPHHPDPRPARGFRASCNVGARPIEDPIEVDNDTGMTEVDTGTLLLEFIAAETEALLRTLRMYVVRAGLAQGQGADAAAGELLGELTVQAAASAERFRPDARPMPWLLGIAANLIKRQQVERAKRAAREPLVADLARGGDEGLSEAELFDRLGVMAAGHPGAQLEAADAVAEILERISSDDARVIRLAVLHDLNGEELGRVFDITPGAARVRLHRALNRLRAAWPRQGLL